MLTHIPVLLNEVLQYLNASAGNKFIDATAGEGGHLLAILKHNPDAEVLGIDLDESNVEKIKRKLKQENLDQRATIVHGNYKDIDKIAARAKFNSVSGILLDLGFASSQLDDQERGFSFQKNGSLDMRYSRAAILTAAKVLNHYPETKLANIIQKYGEEKFSRQIAKKIVDARKLSVLTDTAQVFCLIQSALPKPVRYKAADSARRVFQAIRVEVNGELDNLQSCLPKTMGLLENKGRLVVISFQSLEDRIVKQFFIQSAKGCVCPPDFPTCVCSKVSQLKILTRKPVNASEAEIENNSRARPAKLRAAEKL